jgi:hypothetical protein
VLKLIVDNYDSFALNMNFDTYKIFFDENLKTTFILQNYDKKIILGFDIPLQLAAIIHMLGCQLYLIMDLQKKLKTTYLCATNWLSI